MNNVLTYKGFIGVVRFASDDHVFYGKVESIDDLITFEGETFQELEKAFQYVIDEHMKDCEREHMPFGTGKRKAPNNKIVRDDVVAIPIGTGVAPTNARLSALAYNYNH
ncbi:MAG: hypothetical protein LBF08_00265 [Dysgonamonadaceae bacterium]|jgi:predicted RNase H-like HicB family nuclease|nr:hypothetical protein [Dysgonamonadaceae bacterium]